MPLALIMNVPVAAMPATAGVDDLGVSAPKNVAGNRLRRVFQRMGYAPIKVAETSNSTSSFLELRFLMGRASMSLKPSCANCSA